MKNKPHKPRLKPKWLMKHPVVLWTRGDWSDPEERDAYYTSFDNQTVRLVREPGGKKIVVKVSLGGVEIDGNWRKVWEHLHLNAMKMPVQMPGQDKGGQP